MLVVDASIAVAACTGAADLGALPADLCGPPLLWSETRSVLHELSWRGAISTELATLAFDRLATLPVRDHCHPELGACAWQLADQLGWAKTYDAEYLALAQLMGGRVVTLDARLRRGAGHTGLVVGPTEV